MSLYPYQTDGATWLLTRRCGLLADEMGLGKTVQALRALQMAGAGSRTLVICPAIARDVWLNEWVRWLPDAPPPVIMWNGKSALPATGSVICSFDWARSHRAQLLARKWGVLIVDEAHYLKERKSKRTQAVFGYKKEKGIAHCAHHVWFLTGTPMPSHPGELWPMLRIAGVTRLSYTDWVKRYCVGYLADRFQFRITGARQETMPELEALLRDSGFMLRRLKSEVGVQLPPIIFHEFTVPPGDVSREMLEHDFTNWVIPQDRTRDLLAEVRAQQGQLEALAARTGVGAAFLQAFLPMAPSFSTLRRYLAAQKVQPLVDLLREELESNAYPKVVVFGVHRVFIEGILAGLRDFGAAAIYGGTPPGKRDKYIKRFQSDPKARVMVCNIQAAGTAVTLTAADQLLFGEKSTIPGENLQALMRIHRIGQTSRRVVCRSASIKDSIDQKIDGVLFRRTRELAAIIDGRLASIPATVCPEFDVIPETVEPDPWAIEEEDPWS